MAQQHSDILDVVIIGAGISGIGCAAHLRRKQPGKSWCILEMRDDLGGTWDLFRYPGIRSDSDLYTFSYDFKPWNSDKAIAGAAEIKAYIAETADEYDIRRQINFGRKVLAATWSSDEGLWTVTAQRKADGGQETYRAKWIFSATGYYDYDQGYRPDFPEEASFTGQIVHPQHWPEDLDYSGKRIAVIGSGATAVTLLPALAEKAAHVVQVQRTPSYIMPIPEQDGLLKFARLMPSKAWTHKVMRAKNIATRHVFWKLCQNYPNAMRGLIRRINKGALPADFDIDTHFNPPYDPWQQRLCAVPDADLYRSLASGKASIVTGHIARFVPEGIAMKSGEVVPADIIVTATGLNLKMAGGIDFSVDGQKVDWSQHMIFRGMLLDGIPNFALCIGYTTNSWTLKVGLLCDYFCQLLAEMDKRGKAICIAQRPAREVELRPLLDFGAGYVQRSIDSLPRQGDDYPWMMTFSYGGDRKMMKRSSVILPEMKLYDAPKAAPAEAARAEAA
ncbi:flavin-containing monooxygenase [Erythrobacter neustonensis]|uniref:FAD-containing monooxygenase EthA n=1 Tax=Erythrobacter neustonensis TaxID=1112 RepID=A0A192D7A4_9SPHN|nr:NAD(P)/FAD-dependent oxidoreductase [Erythrobacter neustonensis]ANK13906.1 FAD-containing monooxygenase EthA [Erythrobacter neustonensis]